jgi:ferritin-like metal-binding protein YciE
VASSIDEQLSVYLVDLHAIELQALAQVKRAGKLAGDPQTARAFDDHVRETERHRACVEDRLQARSYSPVPHKDIAGRVTGVGMTLFARLQPDTPGKLLAHAYSYEHMELAGYQILELLAERAGDAETAQTARMIAKDEREMARRLAAGFDAAVAASLREHPREDLDGQLTRYLTDAHAIEQQSSKLLEKAPDLAGSKPLAEAFSEHLEQTRQHSATIERLLAARDSHPSALKDAALTLGGLNLSLLFSAQTDTPAKLAAFAYAFEHLEIASYELLARVAAHAGEREVQVAVDEIILQERSAAARIHILFEQALDASLQESLLARE